MLKGENEVYLKQICRKTVIDKCIVKNVNKTLSRFNTHILQKHKQIECYYINFKETNDKLIVVSCYKCSVLFPLTLL